jgi:hypothetical protein
MDETCTAGKKYGKETVKGDPTRGQDSIGGRAEGEREGNVTRWLSPHMHATRLLGEKVDLLGLMEGVNKVVNCKFMYFL